MHGRSIFTMAVTILCFTASNALAGESAIAPTGLAAWKYWIVSALILLFTLGLIQSVRTYLYARWAIHTQIDRPKPTLAELSAVADQLNRQVPFILILVPARNESAVIRNTIDRLVQLEYPSDRYAVVLITDARERSNNGSKTTQDIGVHMANELNATHSDPFLYVIDVPEWHSGQFGNPDRTYAKSTKGRALNYALEYIRDDPRLSQAEMLGVLDADGRLHRSVLCEVAYGVLTRGERLMQGPVFQVSNFTDVSMAGKAAGIELSMYHLSTLSRQLLSKRHTARFLAGTNYFIDRQLMMEVGGWNEHALVEDAELGLRLFLHSGIKPAWLSCHEVEQTPPDRRVYLRQRERWALGHFQLLPMIRQSDLPWHTKAYLHGKVLSGALKSGFDIGLPVLAWAALALGWTRVMSTPVEWYMLGLLFGSAFVWDFFGRGAVMLAKYGPKRQTKATLLALRLKFILAMPWLILLQAQPRITAFCKYLTGRYSGHWEKTPRTAEMDWEPLSERSDRAPQSDRSASHVA